MSDDYLWDRSGAVDDEVARSETLLARHRFDPATSAPPAFEAPAAPAARRGRARRLAIAGVVLALAAAGVLLVAWLRGSDAPSYRLHGVAGRTRLRAGEELTTARGESARVEIAQLGEVELDGGSQLRVDDCGERVHSLYLARGSLRARITARPRAFQIDTPACRTVDLGCAYELTVDDDGRTSVLVTHGQVEMVFGGREVYVPAHARCEWTRERGPSWPMFATPSAALRDVLALAGPGGDAKGAALKAPKDFVDERLRECTDGDTLTLWHIYDGEGAPEWLRESIHAALAREFPLPAGVDTASIEAGDREARRRWRDSIAPAWRVDYRGD